MRFYKFLFGLADIVLKRSILIDIQQLYDRFFVVAFFNSVHHVYLLPCTPLAGHVLLTYLLKLQNMLAHALDREAIGLISEAALVNRLNGVHKGFREERRGVFA